MSCLRYLILALGASLSLAPVRCSIDLDHNCLNPEAPCFRRDTQPPGDIADFTAIGQNTRIALSWVNPADPDLVGVKILRKTGSYPVNETDGTVVHNSTGTSAVDTGLTNGTQYFYKAFAYDLAGYYASGAQATATPNILDTTFNSGSGPNATVWGVSFDGNGKIFISGDFTTYAGVTRQRIARLNADGTIDTTFDSTNGANNNIEPVVVDAHGKILIAGNFTTYAGVTRQRVARLNADGSLDTTFNSASGANNVIYSLNIDSSGKILIAGDFTTYAGTTRQRVARLNADGSLDTTFNSASGANLMVVRTAIDANGKILIAGNFATYAGTTRQRVARLNADGSLDTTFNSASGANNSLASLAIDNNGKILIAGGFTAYAGTTRQGVARLNADGSLDTTFNSTSGANNTTAVVNKDGNGKILIGGNFISYAGTARQGVARLNADGSLDTTFNSASGANNYIYGLVTDGDGRIYAGGAFTTYAGAARPYFVRLWP